MVLGSKMEATTTSRRHALVPSACDVSITNVCNATCNFCSYAYDKQIVKDKRWIVRADLARALPILYRRGIRYLNFQGGEPLLHPDVEGLVADARAAGMRPALITNGWLLPQKIEGLIAAGLGTLLVSIDSHELAEHERNRGLKGVGERVHQGLAVARRHRIPTLASVTVSRLVRFDLLPELLHRLGFDGVTFSYPRATPLGSSSLVYNANSDLVRFETEELVQALEAIKSVRHRFHVLNPSAGINDIQRHVRGQQEQFACTGGHKYFYLDWNLNIWRCEAWSKPLGSVFDLDSIPDCRDRCTACMMSCYRDTSVLMHAGVALEDAASALARGHPGEAVRLLFRRTVARSLGAALAETRLFLSLMFRRRRRSPRQPETPGEMRSGRSVSELASPSAKDQAAVATVYKLNS
jgi:MoaA/NifB/PqqE/SkfB family radical SAM enzyme